ncbi:MAG: hypothetical protein JJ863_00570 [Deltaproteobacteria bacterium]|nr:hypothetical protein [Deltaproteobacteria bacterium]
MVKWWSALSVLLLLSVSCGSDDGVLLRVDVLTDYVPGLEFETVEISVEDADFSFRRPIEPTDEFLRGQRVGELQTAGEESIILVGRLLDRSGGTVARRRVSVALRERSTQTLVFTRSCAEVTCPAADPSATECQGGACVSPDCSPENPDACTEGCASASDCEAPSAACAEARCVDGVCLDAETEGSCAAGEVCQPATGCVVVPDGSDMGMVMDAGMDAGSDMGPTDLGMPDCLVDADCDDGAYCNGPERCLEGVCAPAESAVTCDDGVDCTVDVCDEDTDSCAATPDDGMCTAEAGGTCDAAMGCQYPVCTPMNCTAGPCQTASCDGDLCVRTNLCGGAEICCGGSCVPAGCDDGNPCTDDSCGAGGCVNANNSDPCSDGNACTVGDQCSGGSCGAGAARNCNDANPCTNDSCNPSSGCVNANNTATCNDGNACTINDRCSGGSCEGGGALNCNDANPCTNDSCNPSSGCVNANNTATCNDGNACTINDRCSGGSCGGGGALNCNDSNPCTNDSCNTSTGCVNTNNTATCNDGNACTINDRCSGGSCSGGGALNCNDGNACTNDSCNTSTGCVYTNVAVGTSCGSDSCDPWGACMGSCAFNDGMRTRTCRPRECNGSGTCVNGSNYLDSGSCTIPEGGSCYICGVGGCGAMASICDGTCSGGCCDEF